MKRRYTTRKPHKSIGNKKALARNFFMVARKMGVKLAKLEAAQQALADLEGGAE